MKMRTKIAAAIEDPKKKTQKSKNYEWISQPNNV